MNARSILVAKTLVVAFTTSFSSKGHADPAVELRKFSRCYALISGLVALGDEPEVAAISAGTLTAKAACKQVLETARLQNGLLLNDTPRGRAVLKQMHRLHMTWFESRDLQPGSAPRRVLRDIYDASQPAFFYTAALFDPSFDVQKIFLSPTLRAVRTEEYPTESLFTMVGSGSSRRLQTVDDVVLSGLLFAGRGDLLGFVPDTRGPLSYSFIRTDNVPISGSTDIYTNIGNLGGGVASAGIPGDHVYLHSIYSFSPAVDGATAMPRAWGKHIFSDLFCRDLPLLRSEDVAEYVEPSSSTAFRTAAACTVCHATMDQAAATIRNFSIVRIGASSQSNKNEVHAIRLLPVSAADAELWPSEPDVNYANRPPKGRLMLRDYKGDLIDQTVASLADLSLLMSTLADPYICSAKRYYRYFSGIDVDIGDPLGKIFSAEYQTHRNRVIQFGIDMKNNGDPLETVKAIIDLFY